MKKYIGIDLGGMSAKAGIVTDTGEILAKATKPTKRDGTYQEILKSMADAALEALKLSNLRIEDIESVGIGSPGTPDNEKGVLVYTNNLNFRNVPMREEMQKHINLPVYIDNDANCAALAESVAGAAKDVKTSITFTLGTGVGSGIIINNKIYSGFNYAASEFGHTVIVVDGLLCTCGRKGCFEQYASASSVIRETKIAAEKNPESKINELTGGNPEKIDAKVAFDAAKLGDKTGQEIVDNYIKYLAAGLANAINAIEPEMIVLGGGVSHEGEYLLKPLREAIYKEVYTREPVIFTKIETAKMGNDAGIIGAAMLGL
jgi:glucokinase